MTEITTNQLEQILNLLGGVNEQRVADAREMLQKITKPKLKPADMSVFIDQPVLCEFWEEAGEKCTALGFLKPSRGHPCFADQQHVIWSYAQPKFGYWQAIRNFEHFNNFCHAVADAGFAIKVSHTHTNNGIFRITDYRDGFGPEWECR